MKCDRCNYEKMNIILGCFPLKLCPNCHEISGFWSFLYEDVIYPLNRIINRNEAYIVYTNGYFQELMRWILL